MIRTFGAVTGLSNQPQGFDIGLSGGSNIKSIQRGSATVNALTLNVTISSVSLANSIVMLSILPADVPNAINGKLVKGALVNATTLALTIGDNSLPPTVNWTVIEFNNVKSLQRGDKTTAVTSDTIPISTVNVAKSILFFSYSTSDTASTLGTAMTDLALTNSTTITIRQAAAVNKNIHWQVVEFN